MDIFAIQVLFGNKQERKGRVSLSVKKSLSNLFKWIDRIQRFNSHSISNLSAAIFPAAIAFPSAATATSNCKPKTYSQGKNQAEVSGSC
jgi:hypothetical protein